MFVEFPYAGAQTGNEPAALTQRKAADVFGQGKRLVAAGFGIETMQRRFEDIDPVKRARTFIPARAFAQLCVDVEYTVQFGGGVDGFHHRALAGFLIFIALLNNSAMKSKRKTKVNAEKMARSAMKIKICGRAVQRRANAQRISQRAYMSQTTKASRTRRSTNRVTMGDVAARARVSASSVSLYLRNPEAVSPRIAPRIKQAIDALGYVPNLLAGSLAAARTRAIGVVVPSLGNAFFSATVAAMQEEFDHHGYQLLLGATNYQPEREADLVHTFLSWSPTALVVTGCRHDDVTRSLLRSARAPVAEMWELGDQPFDLQVGFSHYAVGEAVARHLIEIGARRVAFVGARMDSDVRAQQRCKGFCRTMSKSGIEVHVEDVPGDTLPKAGAHALSETLRAMPDVDAVACSNDVIALGVIFEAQRRGLSIPHRLRVAGFGDLPFSEECVPPLTTVQPRAAEIGVRIAQELMNRTESPEAETAPRIVDVGFELLVRGSTQTQASARTARDATSEPVSGDV
ncbi:Gluconate utilization system Gnt-I transcriptional repressor [Candidatus Burkholderia humilis]|nr:Gluconate utilization system Gnt-I transcriptional repressor [Candidatus Burkholderia humilis]